MVPFAVRPVPEQVCHTHNRFIFLLFNPVFCFVVNCNSLYIHRIYSGWQYFGISQSSRLLLYPRKPETRLQVKWASVGTNGDRQKWKWRQRKREKEVSAPAASGLYFPRHSDFISSANKERALCVSMVTPRSCNDGENKGAGKGIRFLPPAKHFSSQVL